MFLEKILVILPLTSCNLTMMQRHNTYKLPVKTPENKMADVNKVKREIPTNLSQAGRLPKHHISNEASKLKWSQSFLQPLNVFFSHLKYILIIIIQLLNINVP